MPRKTFLELAPQVRAGVGFNEAAARCRGKPLGRMAQFYLDAPLQ